MEVLECHVCAAAAAITSIYAMEGACMQACVAKVVVAAWGGQYGWWLGKQQCEADVGEAVAAALMGAMEGGEHSV